MVLEFLKSDFLAFIGTASISGLAITFLFKQAVTHTLDRSLEKHKHEWMMEIEDLKLSQQFISKGFELYTSKKHEKYPELYRLTVLAYQDIVAFGEQTAELSENMSTEDLEWHMVQAQIGNLERESLLDRWEVYEQRGGVVAKMNSIRFNLAKGKWLEANECFDCNELYLSDAVIRQMSVLLDDLWQYLLSIDPDAHSIPEVKNRQQELISSLLPDEKAELKVLMKKELTNLFSSKR
ncbi:MAG: hypothetical protein ACI4XL_00810 [Bacillus sp. (in: firmicutes)]